MTFLQGQLLVASPHLADPNFAQTVVLMIQHDEEGAFGLILNRPLGTQAGEVWNLLAGESFPSDQMIFQGGPVEGPLTALHTNADYSEAEVYPGLFFSADQEGLYELFDEPDQIKRICLGYAGWGAGQLEQELDLGGWLTTDRVGPEVFDDPENLWKRTVEQIGLDILGPSLGGVRVPQDPSVN